LWRIILWERAPEVEHDSAEDFEQFVAHRRVNWVRAAMRILRNAADAEDVVQDTLMSVWRQWQKASLRNPEGYVSRAVTINALRRRSRQKSALPIDAIAEPSAAAKTFEPMEAVELERAIGSLSPAQQAVIRTKYYVGMTFTQIGKSLSISSNTAASRCRYALQALRRKLGESRKKQI
jgi:RNA polymerase sigma-70 factor, ECF subfamily